MTSLQKQQVDELARYGWEVVSEEQDHIEMLRITFPNGAFAVTHVYPYGSFSWEGSYPLAKLEAMFPTYDYMAGE